VRAPRLDSIELILYLRPAALDSTAPARKVLGLTHQLTMGQQTNKIIKKKRRVAYLKRKKARLLAAKKK
jgi:hypothetical protein